MLGKRTLNAMVRSFFKVKTAKGLSGYLGKVQKKGGDDNDLQVLLDMIKAAGVEKLHSEIPVMGELTTCILHQNCVVVWDSMLALIADMKNGKIDDKTAQKRFRDLHCANTGKMI